MSWIQRNLRQTITHWAKSGTLTAAGFATFSAPVTLSGRWEDKTEEIFTAAGKEVLSRSTVFLESDVSLGDYLFLGTSTVTDPTTLQGSAFVVKDFRKVPQLRGDDFERTAFL